MKDAGIPEAVRRFVLRHVNSIEALEVLLLLFRKPDKWWSAQAVGDELGTPSHSAEKRLEELASGRFLDARIADTVLFRFSPVTPELEAGVRQLAETYPERRIAVINLVTSKGVDEIRSFADAFRLLKKKEEEGDG